MSDTPGSEKRSTAALFGAVLARFVSAFVILGAMLFAAAGTFEYLNAWIYLLSLMTLMGIGFGTLFAKDRSLLEKRLRTGERERSQKLFIVVSTPLLLGMYVIPGLDYRFGWSSVPVWAVLFGEAMLVAGYVLFLAVMRENSYASRVVEIQNEQRLIDTGPYAVVRHPMYSAMILIYLATPLILGSWIALIPGVLFLFTLTLRIGNEEKVLVEGLEGYPEYTKRVKYRLVPFVW